jgi:hypothetical protein
LQKKQSETVHSLWPHGHDSFLQVLNHMYNTAPADESSAPADESTVPADEFTALRMNPTAPADESTAPADQSNAPP